MLYALAPRRIFDVGVGFGRWGMLAREICDVWYQRVLPCDWRVEVIGVEAFAELVQDYHRSFYNRIEIGDAIDVLDKEPGVFDLVIIGDVLEHFDKPDGHRLLATARRKSAYTVVNVPLGGGWEQGARYGNPFERHRSRWDDGELMAMRPVCHRTFRNFSGKPHGVYLFASPVADMAAYWKDRPRVLKHAAFPEILDIYGPPPRTRARPTPLEAIHNALVRYPLAKSAARKVYRAARRLAGRPVPAVARPKEPAGPLVRFRLTHPSFPALAIVRADSYGVTTAASQGFPNLALCPPLARPQVKATAEAILERGFSRIVFHDLAPGYELLAAEIAGTASDAELFLVWHGSFAQLDQAPQRDRMKTIARLCREGVLSRVGFVKAGMAEVARLHDMDAMYVPNRVRPPEATKPGHAGSPAKVGVFARDIFRKNAHTQLMAAGLLDDVEIHVNEPPDLAYFPPKAPIVVHGTMEHDDFLSLLGAMDVLLHSTLSECYPMMVVESLIRGVPCVTSHTSEIFAENPSLYDKLVVSALDNPVAIAAKARRVLHERASLSTECIEYALHLNRRAEQAINDFLKVEAYPATGETDADLFSKEGGA